MTDDELLTALFADEAISEETWSAVAAAHIAISGGHWLGADFIQAEMAHAVRAGIIFG